MNRPFLFISAARDGGSGLVLPPQPPGAGRHAGGAGGGAGAAEGGVRAPEAGAGQAGGGAEEAEAAGQRPGGLHRHAAGAHHGAEAHPPASALQVKVTGRERETGVFSLLRLSFLIQTRRGGELTLVPVGGSGSRGGSECSGSSGCFQVHTAGWFRDASICMDLDCGYSDSFCSLLSPYHKRSVRPTPRNVFQRYFLRSVAVPWGKESERLVVLHVSDH